MFAVVPSSIFSRACWTPSPETSRVIETFWDVLPTLAELGGVASHVPEGLDGVSFAPTLLGREQPAPRRPLFWAFYERGGGRAMRDGDWKTIQQPIRGNIRLYNLQEDIGEENDIAADHEEIVARMEEAMDKAYAPSSRWRFPQAADSPR